MSLHTITLGHCVPSNLGTSVLSLSFTLRVRGWEFFVWVLETGLRNLRAGLIPAGTYHHNSACAARAAALRSSRRQRLHFPLIQLQVKQSSDHLSAPDTEASGFTTSIYLFTCRLESDLSNLQVIFLPVPDRIGAVSCIFPCKLSHHSMLHIL